MASLVDTASGLPVLEIGPGTGVVTRAILARGVAPENLWCVEYSPEFTRHLQAHFPDCHIVHGDAFALEKALPPPSDMLFDCVISGLPLLNFTVPQRVELIEDWLERVPFGRPVVQFTYGPRSPLPPGLGNYIAHHHTLVLRNVPPANIWTYRRRLQ
jgi:phosphatidylethanolamine/phosphatidyl-N-methylethanolamine N-methyltransferase